jgi:uncharacterized small protein (DUF1192 family)
MDIEDLEPRNKPAAKKNLDPLGVDELEAYLAALEAEMARVRAEIEVKRKRRSGAESIFKR